MDSKLDAIKGQYSLYGPNVTEPVLVDFQTTQAQISLRIRAV